MKSICTEDHRHRIETKGFFGIPFVFERKLGDGVWLSYKREPKKAKENHPFKRIILHFLQRST